MNTEEAAVFGRVIAGYRCRSGRSQEEIADRAAISVRQLRNIECGKVSRPRPRTILALVEALGLDHDEAEAVGEFIGRARPPRPADPRRPARLVGPAAAVTMLTGQLDAGRSALLVMDAGRSVFIVCPRT